MNKELMSLVLRSGKLSAEEWITFLELVRKDLNPRLDQFTLKKFGELACIPDNGFYGILSKDSPVVGGEFSLEDHGISYFADSGERLKEVGTKRKINAWGLSKKGKWVTITIFVECVLDESGTKRERAMNVHIWQAPLNEVLEHSQVTPFSIWQSLRLTVESWEMRNLRQYEYVHGIADRFRALDSIILELLLGRK